MQKRLIKKADSIEEVKNESEINLEAADMSLDAIEQAIDQLYDSYLQLFKGLNSIYEEYPKLYDAMKKVVKFPTDRDAQTVAEMKVDFEDVKEHYKDEEYLSNILNLHDSDK